MTDENSSVTPTRALKRRPGQRLNAAERKAAQEVFLRTFANCANLRASATKAGVDRNTIYQWLESDDPFSMRYHQAEMDASDCVRAEIWRRAISGVEEPVISMGNLVYETEPLLDDKGLPRLDSKGRPMVSRGKPITIRKYSDALLALLARSRMQEFKDSTKIDMTANVNSTIQTAGQLTLDMRSMSGDQLARLKQIALELKADEENRQ